jgi:radical SAM protein with 4Fe4S-binding SPASM domain
MTAEKKFWKDFQQGGQMSEIKPLAGMERPSLKSVLPLKTPYAVYIFPTNLCNFMCNYCGHSMGLARMKQEYDFCAQNMSMETLQRTTDQLGEFPDRLKTISLTGHGEPLVNPLLEDMVEYINRSNVTERIETISNASLLTHERSLRLVDAGLDCIRISLQGVTGEKYRQVCGKNIDFEKFVDEIAFLYDHRKQCRVFVKVMDVALDKGEEEIFYRIFDKISDRMYVEQCRPVYSGVGMTENMECGKDRYGRAHDRRVVCPLCFYMLGIHPNGDVAPCETIYKPITLGNVYDDSIVQMWNGAKNREFQRMQLRRERFGNHGCARCCAPDDVAHPEDELDSAADSLIRLYEQ